MSIVALSMGLSFPHTEGQGSGRATDGRELAEVKRTADPFRPAHLAATCLTLDLDVRTDLAVPDDLVLCKTK
jgi:hypothetical protein